MKKIIYKTVIKLAEIWLIAVPIYMIWSVNQYLILGVNEFDSVDYLIIFMFSFVLAELITTKKELRWAENMIQAIKPSAYEDYIEIKNL